VTLWKEVKGSGVAQRNGQRTPANDPDHHRLLQTTTIQSNAMK
jgi:hypothetical protein